MVRCSYPLGALVTMTSSPVRSHLPSSSQTKASAVAFSLFRYPSVTDGDCTSSSPGLPYSVISLPSGSTILALAPGNSEPEVPGHISCSLVEQTTVADSVIPASMSEIARLLLGLAGK